MTLICRYNFAQISALINHDNHILILYMSGSQFQGNKDKILNINFEGNICVFESVFVS